MPTAPSIQEPRAGRPRGIHRDERIVHDAGMLIAPPHGEEVAGEAGVDSLVPVMRDGIRRLGRRTAPESSVVGR
jgi:hypothetical protein